MSVKYLCFLTLSRTQRYLKPFQKVSLEKLIPYFKLNSEVFSEQPAAVRSKQQSGTKKGVISRLASPCGAPLPAVSGPRASHRRPDRRESDRCPSEPVEPPPLRTTAPQTMEPPPDHSPTDCGTNPTLDHSPSDSLEKTEPWPSGLLPHRRAVPPGSPLWSRPTCRPPCLTGTRDSSHRVRALPEATPKSNLARARLHLHP